MILVGYECSAGEVRWLKESRVLRTPFSTQAAGRTVLLGLTAVLAEEIASIPGRLLRPLLDKVPQKKAISGVLCPRVEIKRLVHIILGLVIDGLAPFRDNLDRSNVRVVGFFALRSKAPTVPCFTSEY